MRVLAENSHECAAYIIALSALITGRPLLQLSCLGLEPKSLPQLLLCLLLLPNGLHLVKSRICQLIHLFGNGRKLVDFGTFHGWNLLVADQQSLVARHRGGGSQLRPILFAQCLHQLPASSRQLASID